MDPRITKPKVNDKGAPKNPDELPALRTYQRYIRYIKNGRPEEEAVALALRVAGVCDEILKEGERAGEKCGAAAKTTKSYICRTCFLTKLRDAVREARKDGQHHVDKICQVCRIEFHGHRDRKNCDEHTQVRMRKRKDAGKPHVRAGSQPQALPPSAMRVIAPPPKGARQYRNPNLPDTWENPLPEHLRELPKPKPVVVPPGFKVKFYNLP